MTAVLREERAVIPRTRAGGPLLAFLRRTLPADGLFAAFSVRKKQHVWFRSHEELADEFNRRSDEADLYYAVGSFFSENRTQAACAKKRNLHLDFDAGEKKYARDPNGTYPTQADAIAAVVQLAKDTGLIPSMVLSSGTGLHVYFVLDEDVDPAEWLPVARALGVFVAAHGVKVDPSCTTDSARVLRPLGSLHRNGNRVTLLKDTGKVWSLAKLRALLHVPEAAPQLAAPTRTKLRVNDALQMWEPAPSSAFKAAERCAALHEVAVVQGDVTEPHWRAMLGVVKFSVEGVDAAHEWSSGHPDYDPDETEAKFNRYEGSGPTRCESFARFTKVCDTCEHRGKVTTPLQLGRLSVQNVLATPEPQRPKVPAEFAALNDRYALVRMGSDMLVADMQTPIQTMGGVSRGLGFLSAAAFRQIHAGQSIATGDVTRALADAWMKSPLRRQYEGCVFAPGEQVQPSILNLYQGWGVAAAPGDVAVWHRLLDALIPDDETRRFMLRWFAWKVQNPGGVPGTILILTGGKGTGKNSLVDPIVRMFGAHGAVFDDSEQVAGRFTGHLMTLAFAVLDEALFTGDPRQMDRIKARVTATAATYEFKGRDPVQGVNRCAFVSLTNHAHVWQASIDERRAAVVSVADTFRGNREFWANYYSWLEAGGAAALLHYLISVDLAGFDPRVIPRSDDLARQVEMTALRSPAAAWWHALLCEGVICWRDESGSGRRVPLNEDEPTTLEKSALRLSFTGGSKTREPEWAVAMRQLRVWVGPGGLRQVRGRDGDARVRVVELPNLRDLRASFSAATGVHRFDEGV